MLRRATLPLLLLASGASGASGACAACGTAPPLPIVSDTHRVADARGSNPELPLDPALKKGVLPNGLTYYILPNKRPEKRAQLWLAVNAGSTVEDDDQRGLAHFVEHMCFNGTRRFPKNTITDFLERSGIKFGADVNAYTNFDETVYKLQVPTDKPELLDQGIAIIRDFADGATFDPAEVEKERGVILEEWRLRRGPSARHADKVEAESTHPSRYTTHHPIGKPEVIKSAPPETIARFYHDWYRPDLMAVVAVGDFAPADVEAKIKHEFASFKGPPSERSKPEVPLTFGQQMTISVESDPELTQARIELANRFPRERLETEDDYRRSLDERLWTTMWSARLDELARRTDSPFLLASAAKERPLRPVDGLYQVVTVKDDGVDDGLAALYREALRIDRYGFTKSELDRTKAQLLRSLERRAAHRDARTSKELVARLVRNFLTGEAVPSPIQDDELAKKIVPTIDTAEVNKVDTGFAKTRHIAIGGPSSMTKPNEAAVRAMLAAVANKPIAPYEDVGPETQLMAGLPARGKVVAERSVPELGVTEWKLDNGVRVVVKPTTNGDVIRMSAFSPGGTSLASDADFDSARFAGDIVMHGGLGPLDPLKLRRALAGKVIRLDAGIGELQEGMTGTASEDDLETLLQLVHLAFTAPRHDENAFEVWRNAQFAFYKNRHVSPETVFAEQMALFSTQDNPRRRPASVEEIEHVDFDRALAIYRDRFGDAGDFTFIFVGNIDIARLRSLAETYLASLPAAGRHETWRDVNVVMPSGVQTKTVNAGSEPKSDVSLTFHGPETYNPTTAHDVSTLAEVLNIRLREVLREDLSGTYGVRVIGSVSRRPKEEYAIHIDFGCAPESVDKLVKATFDEIASLQANGIAEDYLSRVREIRKRTREVNQSDDAYWVKRLEYLYTYNDNPKEPEPAARTTSDRIRESATKYLDAKQYILGVLRPAR